MKKRILSAAVLCSLLLTGCSSKDSSAAFDARNEAYNDNGGNYQYVAQAFSKDSYAGSYDIAAIDEEALYDSGAVAAGNYAAEGDENEYTLASESIQKEMLVYSCYMTVDTLDFNTSMNAFKNNLNIYGGFIETENFSDGGGGGRWYYENEEKWQSYNATVRIPSKNYEAFCNSAGDLGDLRSKTSNVQNLSQEYSDLSTTLEIYEAKEQRYIALLADITEDEYAVAIEKELTDIQIQIAGIKTRMNQISTDVAYSYVYFTLNEVKEYVSEPVKTDTFFDRLVYTLKDAGETFLDFLEGLLFFLIYTVPYLLIIGIIIFIIVKSAKKRSAKKREKMQEQKAQQAAENAQNNSADPFSETPYAQNKTEDTENKDGGENTENEQSEQDKKKK